MAPRGHTCIYTYYCTSIYTENMGGCVQGKKSRHLPVERKQLRAIYGNAAYLFDQHHEQKRNWQLIYWDNGYALVLI